MESLKLYETSLNEIKAIEKRMAFEQITNLKSYKKIKTAGNIESTQIKLEIENLKSILSAYTNAYVSRFETDGSNATVFANAKTTVIFIDNDNKIASVEKTSEFSFSVAVESSMLFFELVEKETAIEKIDGNQFVATAKFDVVSSTTTQTEFFAVKPGTENVIEKTKKIKVQNDTNNNLELNKKTINSNMTIKSLEDLPELKESINHKNSNKKNEEKNNKQNKTKKKTVESCTDQDISESKEIDSMKS